MTTHRKIGLSITMAMAFGVLSTEASAALYWTPWVSEEGGGPATICTQWNEGAVGFGCSGSRCDNVRMLCETLPYSATLDPISDAWTGFFSEEHDSYSEYVSEGFYHYYNENYRVCHAPTTGGIMNGIRCSGSYCDNINMECAKPVKWNGSAYQSVPLAACSWTGWYSEEQGSVDFGFNHYITGVECQGGYCDNKRFYVCALQYPGF